MMTESQKISSLKPVSGKVKSSFFKRFTENFRVRTFMTCVVFIISVFISATAQNKSAVKRSAKILLIQGSNMSYLGKRDPKHYGSTTAAQLDEMVKAHAKEKGYQLEIFYTNSEGDAIDKIYSSIEAGINGIVMNPGGFTYGGLSLRDCLTAVPAPYVEVHMLSEKDWSEESVTAAAADGKISGFGVHSYILGLDAMLEILSKSKTVN